MTIGVINEFRGRGIAEYMIDKLKQTVRESN
jgi:ribosomal protein S18 acetylase RimI-like enzyme